MKDFVEAINKVSSQNILHTAVPKPKLDFVRELISIKIVQPKKVLSIFYVINMSKIINNKSYQLICLKLRVTSRKT